MTANKVVAQIPKSIKIIAINSWDFMSITTDLILGISTSLEVLIQAQASSQEAQEALQQSNAQKDALIEHLQSEEDAAQEELEQINQALSTLFEKAKKATPGFTPPNPSTATPVEQPGDSSPTTPTATTTEGTTVVPSTTGGVIDTAAMPPS